VAADSGPAAVAALVLWYPALDLAATFLAPSLPGMAAHFNPERFAALDRDGFIALSPAFRLGAPLVSEMRRTDPVAWLRDVDVPVLTIHGDRDSYVPYDVAAHHGTPNSASRFLGLPGAEHGFPLPSDADAALRATVAWFAER
jgi:pimeloyl-ACP methyl ester carboxylesterase